MKTLELSKKIYSLSSIEETIRVFKHLGTITKIETRYLWKLVFRKCRYDELRTVYEFENYLIGLENQNGHH